MKITVKKLADLRKPAHNIRRHSDKQITEYIRSIEMFGQIKPAGRGRARRDHRGQRPI